MSVHDVPPFDDMSQTGQVLQLLMCSLSSTSLAV